MPYAVRATGGAAEQRSLVGSGGVRAAHTHLLASRLHPDSQLQQRQPAQREGEARAGAAAGTGDRDPHASVRPHRALQAEALQLAGQVGQHQLLLGGLVFRLLLRCRDTAAPLAVPRAGPRPAVGPPLHPRSAPAPQGPAHSREITTSGAPKLTHHAEVINSTHPLICKGWRVKRNE